MIAVRSFAFNVLFYLWVGIFSIGLTFCFPLPRRWLQAAVGAWMRSVMTLLRLTTGISYEVRGWANLPPPPAIIASKHHSAWDTGIFYAICPDPAYVLKRELIWIPFYGWSLWRVGSIAVDRSAKTSALKRLLRKAGEALAARRYVVIFPEGTRTAVGVRHPYHPGVAALDKANDAPVVPVAVNSGLYWPRRSFLKKPGTIVIEFLPPLPKGLDRRTFMAELENRIETATARLVEEAGGPPPT